MSVAAVAVDSTRDRLAAAAFSLFAGQGFANTTVDQITETAGVARRTFFRHFPSKEDVIFPDHDRLLAAVAADLETRRHEPGLAAVCGAVRLVLADYVAKREVSLHRYQLTREVTALRERELTGVLRYQRMFTRYLRDSEPHLAAELMSAAVVAAHNHVLRNWLRDGGTHDPFAALDRAFADVQRLFDDPSGADEAPAGAGETVVVAFRSDADLGDVVASIRELRAVRPVEG